MFQRATFSGRHDRSREIPVGGTRSVDVRSFGGAIGYQVSDRLSLGGGVSVWTFDLDASFARFGIDGNFPAPSTARALLPLPSRMAMMPRPRSISAGCSISFRYLKVGGSFRRGTVI